VFTKVILGISGSPVSSSFFLEINIHSILRLLYPYIQIANSVAIFLTFLYKRDRFLFITFNPQTRGSYGKNFKNPAAQIEGGIFSSKLAAVSFDLYRQ